MQMVEEICLWEFSIPAIWLHTLASLASFTAVAKGNWHPGRYYLNFWHEDGMR